MKVIVTLGKTFFPKHPRKGQNTDFRAKVVAGLKVHTCRPNYEHWRAKMEKLTEKGGVLSVREWIGRPYHQPGQETITDIPAGVAGVQKLELSRERCVVNHFAEEQVKPIATTTYYDYTAKVDGHPVHLEIVAENDGLTVEDFKAWFAPAFDAAEKKYPELAAAASNITLDFAIIHFTKRRY